MLTMNDQEIGYVAASFRAWCMQHKIAAPDLDTARAYFDYVQGHEPSVAEFIDGDWDDFLVFLNERRLLR